VRRPTPPPENPERLGDPKRPRTPVEAVGRGGVLPLPKDEEATPLGSLLYPLWDGYGLAWLLMLPPVLTVASLVVFGLIPLVMQGGVLAILGPVAFATFAALVIFSAYGLQVLHAVLVASAQGKTHHPGWPDFELVAMLRTLLLWSVALGLGVGPSLYAALDYLGEVPEGGPEVARLVAASAIAASGGLYALAAVLAVSLFDDPMAASPLTVLPALLRLNLAYLAPLAWWVALVEALTLAVRALYRAPGLGPLVLMTWAVWVGGLYGLIVLMRLLGRAYHRKSRQVGWFLDPRDRMEPPASPPPRVPIPDL
jgi:hypothetical protein